MVGTVTNLGFTSDIDMQGMLEQLRQIDEESITRKENIISETRERINEFNTVNSKLLALKNNALNLSLESTYLERTITSSNENVLTASVSPGTSPKSTNVEVSQLVRKSSWLSSGVATPDSSIYVPTTQESTTGVTDPDVNVVAQAGKSITITFGGSGSFTVDFTGDTTMNELVELINNHAANVGDGDNGRLVTAETYLSGGETYMRIRSDVSGGVGEENRVAISEDLTTLDFSPPIRTLEYQVDGGDTVAMNVAADTTLSELASLINDDENNPGITASVINDGGETDPCKLSLVSDTEGEAGRISFITRLTGLTMTEQAGAGGESLNALFSVDGITYQRPSNTIDDVISGVTMVLGGTGATTVAIDNNNTRIKEYIQGLVEDYNTAVQELEANTAWDEEEGEFGILARTTLRDLPYTLRTLMTTEIDADSTGEVTTLFDLGLTYNRDGSISLDESILDEVIADHPESVQAFLLGDPENYSEGLADKINDTLRSITGNSGQIAGEKNAAQARIEDLEADIEEETRRLDKKYEKLTRDMINLSQYMDAMEATGNFLTSQFESIAKGWVGNDD